MKKTKVPSLISILFALAPALTHNVGAASPVVNSLIVNGSLDGPATSHSVTPSGWSNLQQGTTDTVSTSGHPFGFSSFGGIGNFPYAASPNGGTFAWSGDFFRSNPAQPEGLRQLVTGFSVGSRYDIRFEFTNLALYDPAGNIAANAFLTGQNFGSSGRWLISLNGTNIGSTPTIAPFPTPGSQVWYSYSQEFTATSTSVTLDLTADWVSGSGTHVGMGIDGISVVQVPESNASMLVLIAMIAFTLRRNSRKCTNG